MATDHSIRYGYISRASAAYLGYAAANAGGGILNTDDGYLAALPEPMHHHIRREVDEAAWGRALAHDAWLREECGL